MHVSNQCQTKLDSTSTRLHLCWFPIRIGGGSNGTEDGRRPKWWRAAIYICLSSQPASQPSIYLYISFQLAILWQCDKEMEGAIAWYASENSDSYWHVLDEIKWNSHGYFCTHNAKYVNARMSEDMGAWVEDMHALTNTACVTNICLSLLSKMYCMLVYCLSFYPKNIWALSHILFFSLFSFSSSSCWQVPIGIVL